MSSLTDVLVGTGQIAAGAGMQAAEQGGAAGAYGGAMLTVTGILSLMAAAEAERAAAWRVADITSMQALLGRPEAVPADLSLPALDAAWDALSRDLIAHHAAVEEAGGDAAAILAFYRESTERRELPWPT
ncbi:hypothetical protein [Sphingomonas corticis]|jgi:hypothetical protein|uniref:Uncharacterized protein n=1 Tax=Sphingomonas corticis TaxID=2722791 RepID=A0ABX1CQS6_9SPHN|nr:hypothetical protein [Sphingomonas corticis]NJR79606.1 hypothetical protein [Sphingomonas corticis]